MIWTLFKRIERVLQASSEATSFYRFSSWFPGQAASAASLLLASGTAGMRNSLPHSRIMVHQPLGSASGQATDIKIHAEEILYLKQLINNLYSKHCNKPVEFINDALERDKFMRPDEAKDFGLIDTVLEHPPTITAADNPTGS